MGFAIVIVVNGECADVVTAGGQIGDYVAVLLAGGGREVAESLLVRETEVQRLGDNRGGSARVVAVVGLPRGVERIRCRRGTAAIYAVASFCRAQATRRASVIKISEKRVNK